MCSAFCFKERLTNEINIFINVTVGMKSQNMVIKWISERDYTQTGIYELSLLLLFIYQLGFMNII